MRFRPIIPLNLALAAFLATAQGASPVAVTVAANGGTAVFGSKVVLTASVAPGSATGKVVFFDGAQVLGSAVISHGAATFSTTGLSSGKRQITAAYLGNGTYSSAKSQPFPLTIKTKPGGTFQPESGGLPNLGIQLSGFAAADLNHDGYPDLVATSGQYTPFGLPATIFIFLNQGNGTFTQGGMYLSGMPALQIAVADVDLDGNPDIVVANASGIFLLSGKGDGTFSDDTVLLAASDVSGILIADMNGDGVPDLVASRSTNQTIAVFSGNGDGTFGAEIDTPAGVSISAITAGDFNRDGTVDIAIGSRPGFSVSVMLGAGNGTFATPAVYPSGDAVTIFAADVNGDGILDLITGNFFDSSITVLPGNADGTFGKGIRNPVVPDSTFDGSGDSSNGIFSLFVSDYDGDGIPDIAAGGNNTYGGLYFFHGHGNGGFSVPIEFNSSPSLALADFNGDGLPDLAAGYYFFNFFNGSTPISVFLGRLAPVLSITASESRVEAGQPLTLTVTSSYPAATGTITFTYAYDSNSPVGTVALVNGTAAITIPGTAVGAGLLYFAATYSGDATYAATSAPEILVQVIAPGPGLTLTASPNPAQPGQQITLTATLSQSEGNAQIAFYDGTNLLEVQTLYSTRAVFKTSLPAGTHLIRAVFPEYAGISSASATVTEQVVSLPGGQLFPGPTYLAETIYGAPSGPTETIAADINHDGFSDLVVLSPPSKSIITYPGTASGDFDAPEASQLSFTPGAMVAGPFDIYGNTDLMVTDPADNAVVLEFYYAAGIFTSTQTFSVGTQPAAIANADFNNDGAADVITANSGSNDVSVLLSEGSPGDFNRAVNISAGEFPDAVVTGDFNGDGNADFVVANRDSNNVMYFAGNGDGTFRSAAIIPAGTSPSVMITADLNGDGKPDLLAANASPGQITILLGNGNGTFRSPILVGAAAGLTSMLATELTGTGIPSLVVTTASGLLVFTGHGDGTFGAPAIYSQYAGAASVSAAPFSNDGRMELAVSMPATNSVSFIRNGVVAAVSLNLTSSSVTEGTKAILNVALNPPGVAGQVDCFDGVAQVGASSVTGGKATITTTALLPGLHKLACRFIGVSGYGATSASATVALTVNPLPSAGLAAAIALPISIYNDPSNLLAGDFNGDGIPDFLYERAGGGLIGQRSGPPGTWTEYNTMAFGGADPISADFNNDGIPDIATVSSGVGISLGNGDGTFRDSGNYGPLSQSVLAALADVNQDGWIDLIIADPDGSIDVAAGNGDGTFQGIVGTPVSVVSSALLAGDFNGDGIADVLSAGQLQSSVTGNLDVLLGHGDGTFSVTTVSIPANPVALASGDFHGDGHQDVAIVHSAGLQVGANQVSILHGNGDGTFGAATAFSLPATPAQVNVADMNGDGKLDLVVLFTTASPAFAILPGNGDGTFQAPVLFASTRVPVGLAVVDTNNDGRLDIVTAGSLPDLESAALEIFRGTALTLRVLEGAGQSATVHNAFASALQVSAPAGATVVFTAPASGAGGSFTGGTSSASVVANSSGLATAPAFIANGVAGSYAILASAPGSAVSVNIPLTNLAGAPASIVVSSGSGQTATVSTAFAAPLSAVVLDAGGNPVRGATITFAAPATGAGGMFANSMPGGPGTALATAMTGAAGIATAPAFTANAITGAYMVSASVAGVANPAKFSLTNIGSVQVTVAESLPGAQFMVDGVAYTQTQTFSWKTGDSHRLSVNSPQNFGSPVSSAFVFTGWSDGGAATHTITVPSAGTTITANFKGQILLTTSSGAGGSMTPATGLYDAGPVTLTATPKPGYKFQEFTASYSHSINNPETLDLEYPQSVTAYFILQSASLQIASSHTGSFTQGQKNAQYTVTVSNANLTLSTAGAVTVSEILPTGLTLVSMAGPGWTCSGASCTRSDALATDMAWYQITVTVNVAANAPSQLVNKVTVSGGGSASATALDPTSIGLLQSIAFAPLPTVTYGAAPFTIGATATSGLPVSFASSTPNVCEVTGPKVSIVGGGLCTIAASQAGNSTFGAAPVVSQSFLINPAAQTITFAPLPNVAYSFQRFVSLIASASSNGPINFSGPTSPACFVDGSSIVLDGPGLCTVTATQPGSLNYEAVSETRTFLISAGPPAVVSLSPNAGAGKSVTFQAVYSDPNGAGDLSELLLQVNSGQSSANACYVYYQPLGKHLYLANNAGNAWMTPSLTPGVAGTASNSQCTLNAGSSSASSTGNDLTLTVALSFNSTFLNSRNVYLYAAELSGQTSGWVKEGAWTPNPIAEPPAIASLTPNAGAGESVTFKAVYSDPNGAGDLSELLLQVNSSQSSANACYVYYEPQGNRLYLANNAGAWITPALTPGVARTVSNSQCTLNAASSSVTMTGNDLTLNVALTFNGAFVGLKNVYLYAAGESGLNSGWVKEGTWTP